MMDSLSSKDWITRVDEDGVIHRVKRASEKQLAYLEWLERELGMEPRHHQNMPAYKAMERIDKLKIKLDNSTRRMEI